MNKKALIGIISGSVAVAIAAGITIPCVISHSKKPTVDEEPRVEIVSELNANQANPDIEIGLFGTTYTDGIDSSMISLSGALRGLKITNIELTDSDTAVLSTSGHVNDSYSIAYLDLADEAIAMDGCLRASKEIDMSTAKVFPGGNINPDDLSKKAAKAVLQMGIKKIPYVGPTASNLLGPTLNKILGIKEGPSISDVLNELVKIEEMLSNLQESIDKATVDILNQQFISSTFNTFNEKLTSISTITSSKYQQLNSFFDEDCTYSDLYKTLSVANLIDFNSQDINDYVNTTLTLLKYLDGSNISFVNKKGILENAFLAGCKNSKLGGEASLTVASYVQEVSATLAYSVKLMTIVLGCKSHVADNLQTTYIKAAEDDSSLASILTNSKIEEYSNQNNIDKWKSMLEISKPTEASIAALHNRYFGDQDSNSVSQWYNKYVVDHWFNYIKKYEVDETGPVVTLVPLNRKLSAVKPAEIGLDRSRKNQATQDVVKAVKNNLQKELSVAITENEMKGLFEHIVRNGNNAYAYIDQNVTTTYVNKKPLEVLKDYGFVIPEVSGNPLFISGADGSYSEHAIFSDQWLEGYTYDASLTVNQVNLNNEYQYRVSTGEMTSEYTGFSKLEYYKYHSNTDVGSETISKDGDYVFYYFSHDDISINSKEEFANFIKSIENGTTYERITVNLNCDIDLTGESYNNFWDVNKNTSKFCGEFNGNRHVIKNLTDRNNGSRLGLFRTLGEGATVHNIIFSGIDINGLSENDAFGAVAGVVDGNVQISDIEIQSGTIEGYNKVGGVVGFVKEGSLAISSCKNYANIKARNEYAGGIVGVSDNKKKQNISGCYNYGKIEAAKSSVGGIVARIGRDDSDQAHLIRSCANEGEITITSGYAGGIIGHLDSDSTQHTLNANTNRGKVTGDSNHPAGGIVGYSEGGGNYKNNANYGDIKGRSTGGIIGENEDDGINMSSCNNYGVIEGQTNAGGIAGWLGNKNNDKSYTAANCFNRGKIIAHEYHAGGIIGQLATDGTNNDFSCCINYGEVTSEAKHAGGIVGYSQGGGNFTQCENTGTIVASLNAGGVLGENEDDSIDFSLSKNTGNVTAGEHAGGIAGYLGSKSLDKAYKGVSCLNYGQIHGGSNAGGIIGCLKSDNKNHNFSGSGNSGVIIADRDRAGGIIGYCCGGGNFTNCNNLGNITSGNFAGGIIGENEDDAIDTTGSNNVGQVKGKDGHTGNIVGYDGKQRKSY